MGGHGGRGRRRISCGGAAPFQRTVKRIVDMTHLHVLCTPVPEEFLAQNVVFFLRNTKGTFPRGCTVAGVLERKVSGKAQRTSPQMGDAPRPNLENCQCVSLFPHETEI